MVNTTVIYRSPRLRTVNPTAALTDDVSYLYTLVRLRRPSVPRPAAEWVWVGRGAAAARGGRPV